MVFDEVLSGWLALVGGVSGLLLLLYMVLMVQATSVQSFVSLLPGLSYRQTLVFRVLRKRPMCNRELSVFLCWPINSVTPRVNELVKAGFVVPVGRKVDVVTGREVIVWGVRDGVSVVGACC